ncbi:MAG: hypothetical protein HC872_05660 [Gammaproteobacteria bacterium]|nr:hypothetical protein [Gammaproteobacteria bacterium]
MRNGEVWLGVDGLGMHRLRDEPVTRYADSAIRSGDRIFALYEDRAGRFRVGNNSGLYRMERAHCLRSLEAAVPIYATFESHEHRS